MTPAAALACEAVWRGLQPMVSAARTVPEAGMTWNVIESTTAHALEVGAIRWASKPTFRFGTAATAASGSTTSTATATGVGGGAAAAVAVAAAAQDFPNKAVTDSRIYVWGHYICTGCTLNIRRAAL